MQNYVSLDIETTGLSPETCDIIEIGAWKVKEGVVIGKFNQLIRPVLYIPRTVQEMTGITMDDVKDCETIEPVLLEFFDWCEDLPFLGHNISFDYGFITYKGKFLGLDFTLSGQRQGIDTLSLCKKYLALPNNKLKTVAESMQIAIDDKSQGYHRAAYDSYITKLVYDRLLFSYPNTFEVTTPKFLSLNDNKYGKVVNNDTLSFS